MLAVKTRLPVIWRVRRSEHERDLKILSQHGKLVTMYVLRSKRAVREFLDGMNAGYGP